MFLCCYDQFLSAVFWFSPFQPLVEFPNVRHLSFLIVHPMQGLVTSSAWSSCLLLFQVFAQQHIFGCHLIDVLLHALGFIQDSDFDTHQTLTTLFGVQSLSVRLGVEISVHFEGLLGLHNSSFHIISWPAYSTDMVSEGWQGVHVDVMDLVLLFELAVQDLISWVTLWWMLLFSLSPHCGF